MRKLGATRSAKMLSLGKCLCGICGSLAVPGSRRNLLNLNVRFSAQVAAVLTSVTTGTSENTLNGIVKTVGTTSALPIEFHAGGRRGYRAIGRVRRSAS